MQTKRIQRKRSKGWKMPANTVYVGRPTLWGNPFIAGKHWRQAFIENGNVALNNKLLSVFGDRGLTRADCVLAYKIYLDYAGLPFSNHHPGGWPEPRQLRGKDLACWCKLSEPCHADVLLDLANEYSSTKERGE